MITITSRENPGIKLLSKLLSSNRERRESGLFVLEGIRLVRDAIGSGVTVDTLYITEEAYKAHATQDWIKDCKALQLIDESLLQRVSDTKTPQGVIAICSGQLTRETLPEELSAGSLMLCSLQDPGNVGTILRTAEAFGLSCVIVTKDCPDITSPKVLRASMGAALRLPVVEFATTEEAILALHQRGVFVCAAALQKDSVSIEKVSLAGACVAIGNEGRGLTEDEIKACDQAVIIPINENSESLNAAMAATVFAWELRRAVSQ